MRRDRLMSTYTVLYASSQWSSSDCPTAEVLVPTDLTQSDDESKWRLAACVQDTHTHTHTHICKHARTDTHGTHTHTHTHTHTLTHTHARTHARTHTHTHTHTILLELTPWTHSPAMFTNISMFENGKEQFWF